MKRESYTIVKSRFPDNNCGNICFSISKKNDFYKIFVRCMCASCTVNCLCVMELEIIMNRFFCNLV